MGKGVLLRLRPGSRIAPKDPGQQPRGAAQRARMPDQVREKVEPLWQRAHSMLVVPPNRGMTPAQLAEKTQAIADTFWPK